jgi:hypothetical protein
MNLKQMAQDDEHFKKCCDAANVKATPRQASKFLNKKGAAWKARNRIKKEESK